VFWEVSLDDIGMDWLLCSYVYHQPNIFIQVFPVRGQLLHQSGEAISRVPLVRVEESLYRQQITTDQGPII
jgi:hypothetical protein